MNVNTIGKLFCLTTFGESHGMSIGGVIDGCPSGLIIDNEMITLELEKRKTGNDTVVSARKEPDEVQFVSGLFEGKTTGAPIAFFIKNEDHHSSDYENIKDVFRPSHADYTYYKKYDIRDYRGGGRGSARTLLPCVVAGCIARQILNMNDIVISSSVIRIGNHTSDSGFSADEIKVILAEYKDKNDTVGAVVHCEIHNIPVGLGEPAFYKFHAVLAHAMMSINAAKGFEYGDGFNAASMSGSECNDSFICHDAQIHTDSNHSGGIQGGITNGETVCFNVAFKPIPSVMLSQNTVDVKGNPVVINIKGRHDVCVVPRVLPIVEALTAMVTLDFVLLNKISRLV